MSYINKYCHYVHVRLEASIPNGLWYIPKFVTVSDIAGWAPNACGSTGLLRAA